MRLADDSVSLKALPVNALIGLEQTTRFTGGYDFAKIDSLLSRIKRFC